MAAYQDVHLKLGLANVVENPLFRLLDANAINQWAKSGNAIRYIKHAAIAMFLGVEELPSSSNIEDFVVDLTYEDLDGDKVMIKADTDLRNARGEFVSRGKVKVLALVEPTKATTTTTTTSTTTNRVADNESTGGGSSARVSVETQTTSNHAAVSSANLKRGKSNENGPEAKSGVDMVESIIGLVADKVHEHVRDVHRAVQEHTVGSGNPGSSVGDYIQSSKSETVDKSPAGEAAPVASTTGRPFIHGRHTCDGCLNTPIVGVRWHAVNMADYDLCQSCKDNYHGTEITFESAELDRDRPFQERWHRRHAKWNRHSRGRRGPQQHQRRGHRRHHPVPPPPTPPSQDYLDIALKEALRRSLADVQESKSETATKCAEESVADEAHETVNVASGGICPDEEDKAETMEESIPPSTKDAVEVCVKNVSEAEETEEVAEPSPASDSLANDDGHVSITSPNADVSIAESKTVASNEPSFASDADGCGPVAAEMGATFDMAAEVIDSITSELQRQSMVDSFLLDDVDDDDESKNPEDISEASACAGATIVSSQASPEHNFAAEVSVTAPQQGNDGGATIVAGEDVAVEPDALVDGENGRELSSQGSWHVVDEDSQVNQDRALAEAAQMIGSALFNSDMARSNENVSTLSQSNESNQSASSSAEHSVSSVTSVPTTLGSLAEVEGHVSAVLLERWSPQLRLLSELGFHDVNRLVDILERLQAAHVGVGSDDEVSVEQVIDEMMTREW